MYVDDLDRFILNMKLLRILRSKEEYEDIIGDLHENSLSKGEGKELTETDERQDTGDVPGTGEG
jgi:hypothetical protein